MDKESLRKYNREYRRKRREDIEYVASEKEKAAARRAARPEQNRAHVAEYQRVNKDRINAQNRRRRREKMREQGEIVVGLSTMSDTSACLTSKDVAEQLNISVVYVQNSAASGRLPGLKIGRDWFFSQEDVDAFNESRKKPGNPNFVKRQIGPEKPLT